MSWMTLQGSRPRLYGLSGQLECRCPLYLVIMSRDDSQLAASPPALLLTAALPVVHCTVCVGSAEVSRWGPMCPIQL